MSTSARRIFGAGAFILAASWLAPATAQPVDEARLGLMIDGAVAQAPACAGLAVGAKQNGVRSLRFYGDAGDGAPPNADTEFEIGSITKTFTATLLAWADQAGTMHLNDPLQAYAPPSAVMPSFAGQPILLLHLADHTSGLPRVMPTPGPQLQPAAVWSFLAQVRLTRAPGGQFLYSNLGFGTLGLAIARKLDAPLETLYARTITAPLGMRDTAIQLSPAQRLRLAQGMRPNGQKAPEGARGFPALNGAGALHSTLSDMMRYLDFELGEAASPLDALLPVLHQPRHAAQSGQIGLGWQIGTLPNGVKAIAKDGQMSGFSSFMVFAPATHTGAVVLSNQSRCPTPRIGQRLIGAINGTAEQLAFPPADGD